MSFCHHNCDSLCSTDSVHTFGQGLYHERVQYDIYQLFHFITAMPVDTVLIMHDWILQHHHEKRGGGGTFVSPPKIQVMRICWHTNVSQMDTRNIYEENRVTLLIQASSLEGKRSNSRFPP